MKIVKLKTNVVEQNTGQIPGLPANPRTWGKEDTERLAKSLQETPELFDMRPLIVVPHNDVFVILGGNLRYDAAKHLGYKSVPALVFDSLDVEKMRQIVLADNGDFGDWDYIALSQDWSDLPLAELGIDSLDAQDFSGKNKEIDPSSFSTDIIFRLKYKEPEATLVKTALGDDAKETLLSLTGYEN